MNSQRDGVDAAARIPRIRALVHLRPVVEAVVTQLNPSRRDSYRHIFDTLDRETRVIWPARIREAFRLLGGPGW